MEAAKQAKDTSTRKLLGDLAEEERKHGSMAHRLSEAHTPEDVRLQEASDERRQMILTYIQPGLAGLMDGSVSTLAPIFAAAFATGIMTTVGGLGHALPYLIPHFVTSTTIAIILVFVELWAISWIQHRWMETPWSRAIFQVVLGGSLAFAAGLLIGTA